ncbi:MAG TPA: glycosyltransferase family 4 protein [Tepidisphaeraceae bacterium]|jgi:glycosyltransferase involved in cell wall biosynthesis|nr:glycosyltransferase family 4 protein [Tepidisphaeraceae bacterium]
MHICLYTETALPKLGGQQIAIDHLARHLTSLGHSITLLTQPPRSPLIANDADLPYTVIRHPRYLSTTHLLSWYKRHLLRLHQQKPIDILHCHSLYPTGYLASLAKPQLHRPPFSGAAVGPRVPLILTSHGGDVRPVGGLLARKPRLLPRYVRAVQSADALVAISRFTRDGYLRFDPACSPRIHDIPNGVDLAQFAQPAPRPADLDPAIQPHNYLLFIGRLTRQKGVDILLQATPLLKSHENLRILIVGVGPDEENLRFLAGSGEVFKTYFLGAQTGLRKTWLLQNALCTILPSRDFEAFGLVALESYASARPIIASNLPGLADLVHPHQTGLLVPPESPPALAAAIQLFLDNPTSATTMGQAGLAFAQSYDWRQIALQHVKLYESLL